MSIHLNVEDRANLERLANSRMKPTRRQKANALLRLAAGLSPAAASEYAGMPKEEVEALAAEFVDGGLARVGLDRKPRRPRNETNGEPWHVTIPSFQDEALFRRYTKILKAH